MNVMNCDINLSVVLQPGLKLFWHIWGLQWTDVFIVEQGSSLPGRHVGVCVDKPNVRRLNQFMRGLTLCPSGCCLYGNIVLPPTDLGCNPEAIDSSSHTLTRPQRLCYLKCEKWSPCPTIYTHYMGKMIGTHLLMIKFRIQVFQPDPLWQVYKNQAPSHAVCIF